MHKGAKNPMSDPRLFANQKIEGESSRGADYIDMKVLPAFLIVMKIVVLQVALSVLYCMFENHLHALCGHNYMYV